MGDERRNKTSRGGIIVGVGLRRSSQGAPHWGVISGGIIAVVGLLILLDNMGIHVASHPYRFWPMILILIGVWNLACQSSKTPSFMASRICPREDRFVRSPIAMTDDCPSSWKTHLIPSPGRRGALGLANVRRRLEGRYGEEATMQVSAEGDCFRVHLSLPAESGASLN